MNAPHELTTAELRAEVNYRRGRLALYNGAEFADPDELAELGRKLARYEAELRRRERYTAPTTPAPRLLEVPAEWIS